MLKKMLLAGLAAMFLSAGMAGAEEENLVKNSSFEEIGGNGMPIGWKLTKDPALGEKVVHSLSTEAHSGKYSAYIRRLAGKEARHSGWLQFLSLPSRTTYKVSAWIKTKDVKNGDGRVFYLCMAAEKRDHVKYYRSVTGNSEWTYYEFTFTTPEEPMKKGKSYIYPVLFNGEGEVWIDDVKITPISEDVTVKYINKAKTRKDG
jgi:hypothetical protein